MSRPRCERCQRPLDHCLCPLIPSLDSRTRTGTVYADLPAPGALRAGMYAEGDLLLGARDVLTVPAAAVVELLGTLRRMAKSAEDVGERLPEEARRIHYGEAEARDIRGAASRNEVEELLEEGILLLPVPPLDDDLH